MGNNFFFQDYLKALNLTNHPLLTKLGFIQQNPKQIENWMVQLVMGLVGLGHLSQYNKYNRQPKITLEKEV